MTASELIEKSLEYIGMLAPYLLIFFAIAFAHKIIDLIYFAVDQYRKRRY
jgi:hypothetical protein